MVVESAISCLDTIDSRATDLCFLYEVLSRGSEIKDQMELNAVVCVFDQAFYVKAMEVYWKRKQLFRWPSHNDGRFSFVVNVLRSN